MRLLCRIFFKFAELINESIDEIIFRIENNLFPSEISAIVLLLYKPSGFGIIEKTLSYHSEKMRKLISLVESTRHPYEIGFDTCFTPALLKYSKKIELSSVDFCESARFSMYIDCEMNAFPCSFDAVTKKYMFQMNGKKISDAWHSEIFEKFRNEQNQACSTCLKRTKCLGGCTLFENLNLCGARTS